MIHRRQLLKTAAAGIAAFPHIASGAGAPRIGLTRVGGIFTVPVTQQWVERMHSAALNAVVRGEIEYVYADNVQAEDYDRILRQLSDSGVELVLGDAFAHEEDARLIARDYPGTQYVMGSAFQTDARFQNFSVFDSYIQDASYLSGIIGGSLTKTGKIGLIGRHNYPAANRLMNAFIDGAREYRPQLEITVDFNESWHMPKKTAELTYAQIASGVDVIYGDAIGVAEAANDSQVPVIGSFDSREMARSKSVVTSARWHFEPTLQQALNRMRSLGIGASDLGIYSYMRHSGCSLAPVTNYLEMIPEEAIERAAQRELEMRLLRFTANLNSARPFSGLFPALE